jgi:hypothetical protein
MQILRTSRWSPANAASAVKKKKYFQTNLIGRIPAVVAGNPSTLPSARLRVKAKVYLLADGFESHSAG